MSGGYEVRLVLEGLALIQQQEWDGDELYVIVCPIRGGARGEEVRHPGRKKHWKLKKSDTNIDTRIGTGVRPLEHTLFTGRVTSRDTIELAFWEEDFAPIDPDDPLTVVTLHLHRIPSVGGKDRLMARVTTNHDHQEGDRGSRELAPRQTDPGGPALGAVRITGKGGAEYGAYLRLES